MCMIDLLNICEVELVREGSVLDNEWGCLYW